MALVHKHMDNPNSIKLLNHDIVVMRNKLLYGRGERFYRVITDVKEMKIFKDEGVFPYSWRIGFKPSIIRIAESEWNLEYLDNLEPTGKISDTLEICEIYRNPQDTDLSINSIRELKKFFGLVKLTEGVRKGKAKLIWNDPSIPITI